MFLQCARSAIDIEFDVALLRGALNLAEHFPGLSVGYILLSAAGEGTRATHMPPEANARVMSAFVDYLKVEKGLAPLSVSAYTTDICQFAEFLETRKRVFANAQRKDVGISFSSCSPTEWMGGRWVGSFRRCGICTGICW